MKVYRRRLTLLTAVVAPAVTTLCAVSLSRAADAPGSAGGHDWPQWRGPHFDGSGDATDLPEKFSPTENLLWKVNLPGSANSTPVVAGGKVFLGSLDHNSKKLTALCLDLKDGHVLWQQDTGRGPKQKGRNDMSSPSPVSDGKSVFFLFGTGDLAAYDVSGKPLWSRNVQKDIGEFHFNWLYGSSPLLYKDKLYFQCLHRDRSYDRSDGANGDSYLLAIDPATGKDLWKQVRPTEAIDESMEAYTTPVPLETDKGTQIVLAGGDCVTGHDAETGKELWRYKWNLHHQDFQRLVPSPVCGEGVVVACAPKGGAVMAVKEGASGDVTEGGAAWVSKEFSSDVCVPLFYRHQLYVLNGENTKTLYCVDAKTGQKKWEGKLGGRDVFRASPTAADGKIFCINEAGELWVVAAGDEFKVLNKISLGARDLRSCVVLSDGHVLVRAGEELYAFGKK